MGKGSQILGILLHGFCLEERLLIGVDDVDSRLALLWDCMVIIGNLQSFPIRSLPTIFNYYAMFTRLFSHPRTQGNKLMLCYCTSKNQVDAVNTKLNRELINHVYY